MSCRWIGWWMCKVAGLAMSHFVNSYCDHFLSLIKVGLSVFWRRLCSEGSYIMAHFLHQSGMWFVRFFLINLTGFFFQISFQEHLHLLERHERSKAAANGRKQYSTVRIVFNFRASRPKSHLKVWATFIYFSRGFCHLLLGPKQGYPRNSPYGVDLDIIYQKPGW